jgi:TRAP-type mannitol/chloroaromatic compound transport system permease small subunit
LKGLLRISRAIDNFVERLGVVVNFLVLLVIVVGFLNVVLRYAGRWTNSDLFGD